MKKFLGLLLLMGIMKKPTLDMYWSKDPLYDSPLFRCIMPRNQFQLLLKCLHFNDNTNIPDPTSPDRDRLYRIRPLLDHLMVAFQRAYVPERHIAIDESLLLWKGRLVFRQYIPMKRARFGIIIFSLCEKSGYTYRFQVYAGKEDPATNINNLLPANIHHFRKPEKMAIFLLYPLLGKGYHAYMDNWYTTTQLFLYLHQRQTMACGKIRVNNLPLVVRSAAVQQDATLAYRSGPLFCLKFMDKRAVHMLTTIHSEETRPALARGRRRHQRIEQQKPLAVCDYNSNMGGVDMTDQMLQPYSATRKTLKWYKKLAIHFIQVALLNAYILYQKTGGDQSFLKYQHDVISSLVFNDELPSVHQPSSHLVRLTQRHWPSKLHPTATWTKPQKRCRVCSKHGQRKDVVAYCNECPDKPGLCLNPCFQKWHTKLDF